jgi:hypothetical protein
MEFLQKYVYGVFELPLPRNAQKRTNKKVKIFLGLVGSSEVNQIHAEVRHFFFEGPLGFAAPGTGGSEKSRTST